MMTHRMFQTTTGSFEHLAGTILLITGQPSDRLRAQTAVTDNPR